MLGRSVTGDGSPEDEDVRSGDNVTTLKMILKVSIKRSSTRLHLIKVLGLLIRSHAPAPRPPRGPARGDAGRLAAAGP